MSTNLGMPRSSNMPGGEETLPKRQPTKQTGCYTGCVYDWKVSCFEL